MKLSSHGHMFFMAYQLAKWYKLLLKEIEDMDEGSTSALESERSTSDNQQAANDVESALKHYNQ